MANITFQRGLVKFNNQGEREPTDVSFDIHYRKVGASSWTRVENRDIRGIESSQPNNSGVLYDRDQTYFYENR